MNIDYTFTHFDIVNPDGSIRKWNQFKEENKFFAGKEIEIIVRKKRAKRNNEQNNLYHAYIKLLAEFTGHSEEEMHSIIGYKFRLTETVDEKTGEIFQYIRSTTQFNKMQFADHLTEIQQWSESSLKVRLPIPGEVWEIRLF